MYVALVKKELRELALLGALAIIAHLLLISGFVGVEAFARFPVLQWFSFIPEGGKELPLIGRTFLSNFTIVSGFFAVILAFRQTFWEESGAALFLFHRPVSWNGILTTKILTGLGVLFLSSLVPIGVYGAWAATPGNHPSPFEWSMAEPAIRRMLCMPLLYLGMFVTVLRPARWYGTKIFPLITCGIVAAGMVEFLWWWPWRLVIVLAACFLLAANICYVAKTRDY